jgi:A/G-specific adenine glycosylase
LEIRTLLLAWYSKNKRSLPWRNTTDPYKIWLSEIILQQTRVAQGQPYYEAFTTQYPTLDLLAAAPEQDILSLWQGLGYYSRARNLHFTAQHIQRTYGGVFPQTYKELLTLKGVGDYTASAIASFAFNLPHPVLDGNVYRVISRLFNINSPIDTSKGKSEITTALNAVFDRDNPALWNQAIMEFGALQCVPKNPSCENCVLSSKCLAFSTQTQNDLPTKAGKTKVLEIVHCYLVLIHKNKTYIEMRKSGIWQNLHQFPLVALEMDETQAIIEANKLINSKVNMTLESKWTTKHVLSHRRIRANFYTIYLDIKPNFIKSNIFETELEDIGKKHPTSVLMLKFLKHLNLDD